MTMPSVAVPKHQRLGQGFSKAEQLKAIEHPGRQTNPKRGYQTSIAWLSDLIALRRILILCSNCQRYFDARRFQYRVVFVPDSTGKTDGYLVNGTCDWCTQETVMVGGGKAFEPEEHYAEVHIEPDVARRASRARALKKGAWDAVVADVERRRARI